MSGAALFDLQPAARPQGTAKALVPVDTSACPACGAPTAEKSAHEDALLRHGGHGATRTTRIVHCSRSPGCPWVLAAEVGETRPPRIG